MRNLEGQELKDFIIENTTINDNECWLWNKSCVKSGHGQMTNNGKQCKVHRLSYQCFKGDIPEGLVVRHHPIICNNPRCCNPDHLLLGTQRDNQHDKILSETSCKGEKNHTSKLTEDDVRFIRDIYDKHIKGRGNNPHNQEWTLSKLGEKFNVSKQLIDRCCRRLTWKHIT
jgi:hypothetical protein